MNRVGPGKHWQLAVTMVVTAAVTFAGAWYWSSRRDPRHALRAAAAAADHRPAEGRVSGFPYRPLKIVRGGEPVQSNLAVLHAAAAVTVAGNTIDDAAREQLTGVAQLLFENWDAAVHALDSALLAATGSDTIAAAIPLCDDATLLGDFAVAHHARARHRNRPQDFVVAAEAASRAWTLARTPEAAWNRALTLEALSLREAALAAWRNVVATEDDEHWLAEAREHLHALETRTVAEEWEEAKRLLERGDARTIARIVSRFPQDAAELVERECLPRWARGETKLLPRCRAIASALRDSTGDSLLLDSVTQIDATNAAAIAHALRLYADGHAARDGAYRIEDAGRLFLAAADELQRANSPFAANARLFYWNCQRYSDDRLVLAATEQWLAHPPSRYPALVARVQWTRGLSLLRSGRPQAAIEAYARALTIFTRVGEIDHVTAMHEMLSEAYEYVGDHEQAWGHRFGALERFGASGTVHPTMLEVLRLCAVAAIREGYPTVGVLFLDPQIAAADPASQADTLLPALLWRSSAHRARGDVQAAIADLRRARRVASEVKDRSVRDAALNQIEIVADRLAQTRDGAARQKILDDAVGYATRHQLAFRLSYLHLQQGLEQLRWGRRAEAERSLFASIEQLERQRATISEEEQRGAFLAARQDVYRILTGLLCARGDYGSAFDVVERSRTRTLFEEVSDRAPLRPLRGIQWSLPADTALVIFAPAGERLGVWLVSANDVRFTAVDIDPRELDRRVGVFRAALRANDERAALSASRALHDAAVRPWYAHARSFSRLVFIADGSLAATPFAALNDRATGEFLIQRHIVSTAPSANVFVAAAMRRRAKASLSALVVAPSSSAASGGEMLLAASREEAEEVAKQYARALVLQGGAATREEFLARAIDAERIHFAGHAVTRDGVPHLLFANGEALYAEDVRRLRLSGTRVVMLAACDSGTDFGARNSQGVSSLARAFLAAGVPAVVASYWNVDDAAAARLSRRFHQFLSRGLDPAAALRNAQLQSLTSSDARSRNVSSWASFVVIGQPFNESERGT